MPYNKKSLNNLSAKGRGRPKGSVNKIKKEDVKKLIKEKNILLKKSKAAGLTKETLIDNLVSENNKEGVKSENIIKPVKSDNTPSEEPKQVEKKLSWTSFFSEEVYID